MKLFLIFSSSYDNEDGDDLVAVKTNLESCIGFSNTIHNYVRIYSTDKDGNATQLGRTIGFGNDNKSLTWSTKRVKRTNKAGHEMYVYHHVTYTKENTIVETKSYHC